MPGLSYPFVFECLGCGTRVEVTRTDARDYVSNPDSHNAVETVLTEEHGWSKDIRGAYCPDCDPPSKEEWMS